MPSEKQIGAVRYYLMTKLGLHNHAAISHAKAILTAAEQAEPAPAADEEEIAKLIWERFAPAHEVEWPSGNASEYRQVAKDIVGKFRP